MIELSYTGGAQAVAVGDNVLFNTKEAHSGCAERWRPGSGSIVLIKPGRYLVTFSGNIAVPTGGTVGEISLAIAQDGEVLNGTRMRVTPAGDTEYFNVSTQHYVDVFCGTSANVAVENTSTIAVNVENANITAVRVA